MSPAGEPGGRGQGPHVDEACVAKSGLDLAVAPRRSAPLREPQAEERGHLGRRRPQVRRRRRDPAAGPERLERPREPGADEALGDERDREPRELEAGLDDVLAGRGSLFLLTGEPGSARPGSRTRSAARPRPAGCPCTGVARGRRAARPRTGRSSRPSAAGRTGTRCSPRWRLPPRRRSSASSGSTRWTRSCGARAQRPVRSCSTISTRRIRRRSGEGVVPARGGSRARDRRRRPLRASAPRRARAPRGLRRAPGVWRSRRRGRANAGLRTARARVPARTFPMGGGDHPRGAGAPRQALRRGTREPSRGRGPLAGGPGSRGLDGGDAGRPRVRHRTVRRSSRRGGRRSRAFRLDARRAHRVHRRDARLEDSEAFPDLGRAGNAREEMDVLTRELAGAIGLGGRARHTAGAAERARTAVQKRVRGAIGRLEDALPGLARHLDATVHTGAFCGYLPEGRRRRR